MSPLILKRAPIAGKDDYDLLEDSVIVGRIFKVPIVSQDQPWMWAAGRPHARHRDSETCYS